MKIIVKSLLASALLAATYSANALEISGAGATFPQPVYEKWAYEFNKAGMGKVNYQGVGSGAGIKQINAKTVDFGASDMPLTDEELAKGGLIQFPTVMGGVVPVVNIAGLKSNEMKLSGALLADIYMGKITKWNDPAIAKLNPGVKLPDAQIAVVRRADASGTTFIFSNYLSKTNTEWAEKYKFGTTVNWPVGTGGKGNPGVAGFVSQLPNSVGYVEYAYAKQNPKLVVVDLINKAGKVVKPSIDAFKAAAAGADWSKTFYQVLTDQPGDASWPITNATYILVHKTADKPEKTADVFKFFQWAYKDGDKYAEALDYIPMPEPVKTAIYKEWTNVKSASGQPVWK
ncbi:MAG: phosphate ABC transporter substrate-binding protein PstS [Thiomonas sp.]|jgi:phosphate transport system substrate-binding protein|nr:phosphate ABC transporter substrate-binding protein PstS [Thiomonas arsenitoxydans]MDE2175075.1 phosphate ABC transporter substrate-binding protein PstS [Betaproteobacteria bacterium]MDE2268352.1 phosphate ABC transporter substrate-binding protein PstS [Betaproteobacteria bacterium]